MDNELNILLQAMQAAGEAILRVQKTGFSIERKTNNDMVTKADLLANDILRALLNEHFPDYGWLSEESVDDPQRLNCERAWVVDPIDGTREFATHIPEYAISVALIENGIPVLASIFNPATNELFHAIKGQGAWQGKTALNCQQASSQTDFLLLASRSEYKKGKWDRFEQTHPVKPMGSIAYKLGLVAAGRGDATFSLGPKNEWDIAAGALIVSEAGGIVTDKLRAPFIFNRKDVLVNGIVATAANINDEVFALISG